MLKIRIDLDKNLMLVCIFISTFSEKDFVKICAEFIYYLEVILLGIKNITCYLKKIQR